VARDEADHAVGAAHPPVDVPDRLPVGGGGEPLPGLPREGVGKDVEHHLHVAPRVEVSQPGPGQLRLQVLVVGHVAVVGHHDSEGVVHREGLGVLPSPGTDGGIAHVAHPELSPEALEVGRGEDVPDETLPLLDVEMAIVGDDAGGVLPPVLDGEEPVVDLMDGRLGADDSDESAHALSPSGKRA